MIDLLNGCNAKREPLPDTCPPAIKLNGIYFYGHLEKQVEKLPDDASSVSKLESTGDLSHMPEENGVNMTIFEIGDEIYQAGEKYYIYNKKIGKYWVFVDWPIEAQMSGEKDEHRNDNYDISQFKKAKTGDIIKFG